MAKAVDRYHNRDTVLASYADVVEHVWQPCPQKVQVLAGIGSVERFTGYHLGTSAVHLECAHGGNQHHAVGDEPGIAALDIEEFLHTHIRTEAGFGDHKIRQV